MSIVKGAPKKYRLLIDNAETDLPASDELANDLDLRLYTDTSKDIAKFGGNNIAIEHPDDGEFIVTIDAETTLLLTEGETAWLEGFILPSKESVKIELGIVEDNRAND
jgi:hypothetical protein